MWRLFFHKGSGSLIDSFSNLIYIGIAIILKILSLLNRVELRLLGKSRFYIRMSLIICIKDLCVQFQTKTQIQTETVPFGLKKGPFSSLTAD